MSPSWLEARVARWLADVSAEAAEHSKSRPAETTGRPIDHQKTPIEARPNARHKTTTEGRPGAR